MEFQYKGVNADVIGKDIFCPSEGTYNSLTTLTIRVGMGKGVPN